MVQALPDQQVKYMTDKIRWVVADRWMNSLQMVEFIVSPIAALLPDSLSISPADPLPTDCGSTNLTTWASNSSSESAVFKLAHWATTF
jgi:hypothetical protein